MLSVVCLCLLSTAAVLQPAFAQVNGYPKYSPCAPIQAVNRGDPFVIGIAYWPGANVLQWDPTGTGFPGYNPCIGNVSINGTSVNYQQYLAQNNVYFSTFSLTTDVLSDLNNTKLEEDLLFQLAKSSGVDQVVSVVAFRGTVRSTPQYIRSASSTTGGQGIVSRLGLLVTMDTGNLTNLEWYDFDGCGSCGGTGSSNCITSSPGPNQGTAQQSCAVSLTNPECLPCVDRSCSATNCSTTYTVAFRGSSVSGQPMLSGYQLVTAFQYSLTSIFNSITSSGSNNGGGLSPPPSGVATTVVTGPPPVSPPTVTSPVPATQPSPSPSPVASPPSPLVPSPSPVSPPPSPAVPPPRALAPIATTNQTSPAGVPLTSAANAPTSIPANSAASSSPTSTPAVSNQPTPVAG